MKFLYNEYNKEYPPDNEKDVLFLEETKHLFEVLELILDHIKR
jgi:hypothetical protein